MDERCFLFGHADTPEEIAEDLKRKIEEEIRQGARHFFVGCRGSFDQIAIGVLRSVKKTHPEIQPLLLLPYHPEIWHYSVPDGFDGTFYPPLETVLKRLAIRLANEYMIHTADSIICYVRHIGNAMNLLQRAKQGAERRKIHLIVL